MDFERKKQGETVGKEEERKGTFNFFFIVLHGNLICNHLISYPLERSCSRKSAFIQIREIEACRQFIVMFLFHNLKKTASVDFRFINLQKKKKKSLFYRKALQWRRSGIPIDKSPLEMKLKLASLKKVDPRRNG